MIGAHNITLALNELEAIARQTVLPLDKGEQIGCFVPYLKLLVAQFKADAGKPIQHLHFAAIYGLVLVHSELIKKKLACYQSGVGYVRSFVETDPSQTYYKTLLDFLNKYENDFQSYRRSDDAKKYIVYREVSRDGTPYDPDHHLGFEFGSEMANENDWSAVCATPSSLKQLEKRIFAVAYFEMYKREVNASLTMGMSAAVSSNVAAAVLIPIALPVTLAATVYSSGYLRQYNGLLGAKAREMKIALDGSVLGHYEINHWRIMMHDMLLRPRRSAAILAAVQPQTFLTAALPQPETSSVRKFLSSLF